MLTVHPQFDTVRACPLLRFGELVAGLGGDARALFLGAGMPEDFDETGNGPEPLTYRQLVTLLNLAAERCACPDFGIRLALLQGSETASGWLSDVMRNARNLGEALASAAAYSHAHSPAAGIWLKPSPFSSSILVGHDILVEGLPDKSQAIEMIMMRGRIVIDKLTQGFVRPHRVLFRHQPLAPMIAYRRHFQCEVRFGQPADGLLLHGRDFAHPVTGANAEQFHAALALIQARFAGQTLPLHAQVRGVITHFLGNRDCGKDVVARELALHPKALLRRLAREGTSFQRIKDEVRRDLLLYYAAHTDLEFLAVSERLGFAEQAVMTRFCHKWLGCSPSSLRAAHAARGSERKEA